MTKKSQDNLLESTGGFTWTVATLTDGRAEIRGRFLSFLRTALALQPNVAKEVPVMVGRWRQLSVLRPESRLSEIRQSLAIRDVDWNFVNKSDSARDALRVLASPIDIHVVFATNRSAIRLSFPEEIDRSGLLDLKREVVVSIAGRLVDFWTVEMWRGFLETAAGKHESMVNALEALTDSGG